MKSQGRKITKLNKLLNYILIKYEKHFSWRGVIISSGEWGKVLASL